MKRIKPQVRLWLSKDDRSILGDGRAELLKAVAHEGSIMSAAKSQGISYKHAWSEIRRIEQVFETKVVESTRGGKKGGSTFLTREGKMLLEEYDGYSKMLDETVYDKTFWESLGLKFSARNLLKGKIVNIEIGGVAATVKIEIEKAVVTAMITAEAASTLDLEKNDEVVAVIKATEVMIGKE